MPKRFLSRGELPSQRSGEDHHGQHIVESLEDSDEDFILDLSQQIVGATTKKRRKYGWAVENVPNPDIVISGSSAGALSAEALSALVADVREVEEKNILYTVLGDSNVDMLPSEYTASKLVSYYGTSNLNLNLTFKLWDQCDDNEVTVAELLSYMIEATTSSRCIVYSYRT
ncbi:hypothetical protein PF010_g4502 [Phytophthora fragariae]|uniref:Uncharacterized protein n=1 Tax=Phytophthora fragariae TaxID=53985 RepID=A0A6A3UMI5_9STRA|nr:hypothetical protein PF011_g4272 [Phytophthora fragariae]KAE9128436.1 hypothetical protein PF010_g4502 [Phytophthora fragariae]KAE9151404.1 hypothetical protein PF006_g4287 [Phytophthora fragariae]